MIKDSIKSTANKIFSGLKTGANAAGSYLLNEMVEEVQYRSPNVAKAASHIKKKIIDIKALNKVAAAKYQQFVEADTVSADSFKEEVKKNNPGLASQKAVELATLSVIRRIEESIKKDPTAAKESELYKKYEKNFEQYSEALKRQSGELDASHKSTVTAGPISHTTDEDGNIIPGPADRPSNENIDPVNSAPTTILEAIESNTKDTVDALKNKQTTNSAEPKTVSTVINNAGADLISKVFTEKTINSYADKVRDYLGLPKEEVDTKEKSYTEATKDPVVDELKKVNRFLEDRAEKEKSDDVAEQENKIEAKKSGLDELQDSFKDKLDKDKNKTVENSKSAKDRLKDRVLEKINPLKKEPAETADETIDTPDRDNRTRRERKRSNRQNKKIKGRSLNPLGDKVVQAGKDKNYIPDLNKPKVGTPKISGGRFTEPAYRAGQLAGRAGRTIASGASRVASGAVSMAARAAPMLASAGSAIASGASSAAAAAAPYALPAMGILAAGAAGYGIGTLAAKGIDSGISALTGEETSLGSWIYDQFNEDPVAKMDAEAARAKVGKKLPPDKTAASKAAASAVAPQVVPAAAAAPVTVEAANTSQVTTVESALNKQDVITAEKEEKMSQPVVINNGGNVTNNTSGGGGGGGGGAIVASPVRNTESTYERVQMQDFWPRAK